MWELVLGLIMIVGFFSLGLIIKNYLPSYMTEKGKNLATKEDIEEITLKTEEVKTAFQKEFANFSTELNFKNDYYYRQYSQLYAKLYAIVVQSEYYRYFSGKYQNLNTTFDEVPFFEISVERVSTETDLFSGIINKQKKEEVTDSVTQYNKQLICDFIIEKGDLASQRLLKLAVAYRFAKRHYSGSETNLVDANLKKAFDEEEFALIKRIVQTIVVDYNALRREIKLEYSVSELETGSFDYLEYNSEL